MTNKSNDGQFIVRWDKKKHTILLTFSSSPKLTFSQF